MIESKDLFCKIISDTEETKNKALSLLSYLGKVAAKRLINEPKLEVFIYKSSIKGKQDYSIVRCSRHMFYEMHRSMLTPVDAKYIHRVIISREDEIKPEEKYVIISTELIQQAKESLAWMGLGHVDRLIGSVKLELRRKVSGIPGLEDHCVVQCGKNFLYPVPKYLLEPVEHV